MLENTWMELHCNMLQSLHSQGHTLAAEQNRGTYLQKEIQMEETQIPEIKVQMQEIANTNTIALHCRSFPRATLQQQSRTEGRAGHHCWNTKTLLQVSSFQYHHHCHHDMPCTTVDIQKSFYKYQVSSIIIIVITICQAPLLKYKKPQ